MISLVLPLLLSVSGANNEVRKPTEREIELAHEMLAGNWKILSIMDDGQKLGMDLIQAKFAESGRVHIGTRTVSMVSPEAGTRRVMAMRIDPARRPCEIDLTTRFDEVLKGIYKFDDDRLILCVAKREDDERPTHFDAPSGSDVSLFELKMVKPVPAPVETSAVSEIPAPAPAPRPREDDAQRRRDEAVRREEEIRQKLIGTWSYVDRKGNMTIALHSDGTFETTRSWAHGIKRLLEGDITTTQGRWNYAHGVIDARITAASEFKLVGHVFTGWIQSVSDSSLVLRNLFGDLKTAQKLR